MDSLSTDLVGPRADTAGAAAQIEEARALTISNTADYIAVCDFEKGLRALDKQIVEHHSTRKRMADHLHKRLVAEEKEDRAPVLEALEIIRPKRISWEDEQERLRKEEEERLQALQREADEERCIKDALEAEAKGRKDEAEKIIEREENTTKRLHIPSRLPKSGIAKREYWGYNTVDLLALATAAVADPDRYLAYLDFNRPRIGGQVQALKELCKIPGIKVWSERR